MIHIFPKRESKELWEFIMFIYFKEYIRFLYRCQECAISPIVGWEKSPLLARINTLRRIKTSLRAVIWILIPVRRGGEVLALGITIWSAVYLTRGALNLSSSLNQIVNCSWIRLALVSFHPYRYASYQEVDAPVESGQKTSHDSETTCWFDLPGLVSYLFLPGSYRLLTNI